VPQIAIRRTLPGQDKYPIHAPLWRSAVVLAVCLSSLFTLHSSPLTHICTRVPRHPHPFLPRKKPHLPSPRRGTVSTLSGVAYLNQRPPADAQKYFEQSLAADPQFEVACRNLDISPIPENPYASLPASRTESAGVVRSRQGSENRCFCIAPKCGESKAGERLKALEPSCPLLILGGAHTLSVVHRCFCHRARTSQSRQGEYHPS
jgi:hypothetical protein